MSEVDWSKVQPGDTVYYKNKKVYGSIKRKVLGIRHRPNGEPQLWLDHPEYGRGVIVNAREWEWLAAPSKPSKQERIKALRMHLLSGMNSPCHYLNQLMQILEEED